MPKIFLAMFLFVTVGEFCSQESEAQSCSATRMFQDWSACGRDQLA
jgi:hypothetical protein